MDVIALFQRARLRGGSKRDYSVVKSSAMAGLNWFDARSHGVRSGDRGLLRVGSLRCY